MALSFFFFVLFFLVLIFLFLMDAAMALEISCNFQDGSVRQPVNGEPSRSETVANGQAAALTRN